MRASLGKFLLAATVGQGVYGRLQLHKIVTVALTTAMLAVIASVMISALVIGGIYSLYLLLLAQGVGMGLALLTTAMVVILLALAIVMAIRERIRELRTPAGPVRDVIDAFLDGFSGR